MAFSKRFKGVVFDFNGTLFWDTKLHNQAWDVFLKSHKMFLTDEEKTAKIHGKNSEAIFNMLFNKAHTKEQIKLYVHEKESIYQNLCLQSKLSFATGAIDFINFLQKGKISYTIATASERYNLDFFTRLLHLEKWFDIDLIVYDNGEIKSKPDPQIFEMAIRKINRTPDEVVIFEDSVAGITAAQNARAGKVIIVNSNNDNYSVFTHEIITDFNQVDRSIFA